MTLKTQEELVNTQAKLRLLEAEYHNLGGDSTQSDRVRELGLRSLKRLINQLTEEIARYEISQPVQR